MAILYTQAQVNDAINRGNVSMYLISQKIQQGFYYFYSPVYRTYKDLQYDIYILTDVIYNENPFVTYSPTPTLYEYTFYELVGTLINKIKQFDVFGQFGSSANPNYQNPGTSINITQPFVPIPPLIKTQADLLQDTNDLWYLPYLDQSGNQLPSTSKPVLVEDNGVSFNFIYDETFSPKRIYGFADNSAPQSIIVTIIGYTQGILPTGTLILTTEGSSGPAELNGNILNIPDYTGGGTGANVITGEIPTGAVNGTNTIFTLTHTPLTGALAVYLNGERQKNTDDYTVSGSTITMATAPITGDNFLADYDY